MWCDLQLFGWWEPIPPSWKAIGLTNFEYLEYWCDWIGRIRRNFARRWNLTESRDASGEPSVLPWKRQAGVSEPAISIFFGVHWRRAERVPTFPTCCMSQARAKEPYFKFFWKARPRNFRKPSKAAKLHRWCLLGLCCPGQVGWFSKNRGCRCAKCHHHRLRCRDWLLLLLWPQFFELVLEHARRPVPVWMSTLPRPLFCFKIRSCDVG